MHCHRNSTNSKTRNVGQIFSGLGNHVLTSDILQHWHGEDIFTHTHPFLQSEGKAYGFSVGDRKFLESFKMIGVMIEADGVYYYDGRHR